MNNEKGNLSVVIGFGVLSLMLIAAAFLLPWKNINWGKIQSSPNEGVTVVGEAKTQEKNQIASFTAGVNIIRDKKEDAVAEVNKKVGELIESVKKFGIPAEDIKTQNMSVYQQQDQMYSSKEPITKDEGKWIVNNSVEIILRDVDKTNDLVNLLNSSGANNVYGPNFRMDDTNRAERDLFDDAMADAREKAEIIAKASGRKLGKVIGVVEGAGGSNGFYAMGAMDGRGGGGAVSEPGSATVSKTITVSFDLE